MQFEATLRAIGRQIDGLLFFVSFFVAKSGTDADLNCCENPQQLPVLAIDSRLVCHLLCQHVDYLANGYCTEVFTRSGAHSRRAGLYFTIADYQHVRHLLQLGLPSGST